MKTNLKFLKEQNSPRSKSEHTVYHFSKDILLMEEGNRVLASLPPTFCNRQLCCARAPLGWWMNLGQPHLALRATREMSSALQTVVRTEKENPDKLE